MAEQKSAVDIYLRMHDQATAAFKASMGAIGGAARGAWKILTDFKTLILGFGAGLLAKNFLDTAASFETLQTQLRTVSTSAGEAEASFAWVQDFATRTPYELEQVTAAFIRAKALGIDPMGGTLEAAGNAASAMGKDLMQAVEAAADAMRGENERLKEFGIKAKVTGDIVKYTWVDTLGNVRETIAKNNPKIIEETLKAIWNERYAGGMENLSKNWRGMWSNLSDTWSRWQSMLMDSGPFQAMKGGLSGVLDVLKKFEQDGSLKRWAEAAGKAVIGFVEMAGKALALLFNAIGYVRIGWNYLTQAIQSVEKAAADLFSFLGSETAATFSEALSIGMKQDQKDIENTTVALEEMNAALDKVAAGWNAGRAAAAAGVSSAAAPESSGGGSAASQVRDTAALPTATYVDPNAHVQAFLEAEASKRRAALETALSLSAIDSQRTAEIASENERRLQSSLDEGRAELAWKKGQADEEARIQAELDQQAAAAWNYKARLETERREREEAAIFELGTLWQGYHAERMKEVQTQSEYMLQAGADRLAAETWLKEEQEEIERERWEANLQMAQTYGQAMTAQMQLWAQENKVTVQSLARTTVSIMDQAISGVACMVAQAVVYSKNMAEMGKALLKSLAAQVIQWIAKVVLQYIIGSIIQMQAAASEMAARVAAMAAVTYAAAFAANIGTMTIYGAAAYAAAATLAMEAGAAAAYAETLGVMKGVAAGGTAGQAHSGMTVPSDGTYLLNMQKGEQIIPQDPKTNLLGRRSTARGKTSVQLVLNERVLAEALLDMVESGRLPLAVQGA